MAQTAIALMLVTSARADDPAEVARIHVAAIGGRVRIAALQSYRATGEIKAGGSGIKLTIYAARPNRLRVEMRSADHTVIQATDGVHPPWQADSSGDSRQPQPMPPAAAEGFKSEADFDDPLIAPGVDGCELEDGGRIDANGRPFIRLLITQRLTHTFFLLIDPETYFIAERIEERPSTDGDPIRMITRYADFRPVAGVLLPHRITVLVDGQAAREATLDHIEANPTLTAGIFSEARR